jgi:tetratricopeptide (TPR) repeat protein
MNPEDVWTKYFAGEHLDVLQVGAQSAEIMHVTGLSLIALGRFDEADTLLMASSLVQPRADWFSNACVGFLEAKAADHALTYALNGLKDFSADANLCFNAANVFTALNRHDDARDALLQALDADPAHWEAAMNLANVYRRLSQHENALALYDRALALNGDDNAGRIRTRLNRAVTLSDIGREDEALEAFDALAADSPVDSPEMDFNRATLRLKLGDYSTGWRLYGRRWDCPMAKPDVAKFQKPILTNLEDGIGKRVLFCHEQGFGDSIQFVRFAPLLVAAGLELTILVPTPLLRLFDALGVPVVDSRDDLDYDFECPMLNAPMLLGTILETIPATVPYLTVPDELIQTRKIKGSRLKVGIVWAGQSRDAHEMKLIDNRRSIELMWFVGLLELDADFFSLQFGDRATDHLTALPPELYPHQVLEPDFDFLDTAAVISQLDLVIAVDTSTAHLAAALGKPTWLLSRFDGCWRWLKDRTDSPWYPTVEIFHQEEPRNWSSVLERVEERLKQLITEKK